MCSQAVHDQGHAGSGGAQEGKVISALPASGPDFMHSTETALHADLVSFLNVLQRGNKNESLRHVNIRQLKMHNANIEDQPWKVDGVELHTVSCSIAGIAAAVAKCQP